ALAHGFAQRFEIGGGRVATIDQEVAMLLRDLCIADNEATAARGIHQLPGLAAARLFHWGIGKGGTAGPRTDRLAALARRLDLVHACLDGVGISRSALQPRTEENPALGDAAMAIAECH